MFGTQVWAIVAAVRSTHHTNEFTCVSPPLRVGERVGENVSTHLGSNTVANAHLLIETEHLGEPCKIDSMCSSKVPKRGISSRLQNAHSSSVVFHEDYLDFSVKNVVPQLKSREPFRTHCHVGGDNLSLRRAVRDASLLP